MAKVTDLSTLAKTSAASTDFLLVTNSASGQSKKLTVESMFPAVATAGTGSETLYNSATLTNKNQIVFKGIKSGDTGLLTVGTTSSNLVLTVLEAGIDLSLCNNATAGFMTGVDFTGTVTGVNAVTNGGTGLSTIPKGAMLYASATDSIAATTAMSTNGQLLIGNATNGYPSVATLTAGAGITITNTAGAIAIAAAITNAESNIDMRNAADNAVYNIDLVGGTAFVSGDGSAEGLTVDNAGKVFIGQSTPTAAFDDTLNIKGGIRFTNTDAPTIKPTATTSSTAGQSVTIEGGSSAGAASGHLPKLDVVGSASKSETNQYRYDDLDTGGLIITVPNETERRSYSIQLSMPIFQGGLVNSRRKKAYADYDKTIEDTLFIERSVIQEVRSEYSNVITLVANVNAQKQAVVSATSALEATKVGYQVGTRNIVDLLQSEKNLYSAERNLANAKYDYILSNLKLGLAAGNLEPENIADINNFLN